MVDPPCSHSDRCEEDRKHAVHHDDEEDSLHHRGGRVLAERFGAALHGQPLDAGDDADHRRHHRRLDDADDEMIDRDGVAQPQQEGFGIDAAIEPCDEPAAMIATSSTPISRSTSTPSMSTTKMSAPNWRKWKMPCCAMIQPIRNVISTMIGTARQQTCSR